MSHSFSHPLTFRSLHVLLLLSGPFLVSTYPLCQANYYATFHLGTSLFEKPSQSPKARSGAFLCAVSLCPNICPQVLEPSCSPH